MSVDPQPELLSEEPVRLPRTQAAYDEQPDARAGGHHRRAWTLAAVVVVAGASLVVVDGAERSSEVAAVESCERQLQDASDHADYRMGLTTNYVRSVAQGHDRTHVADLMAPRARQVLPQVERARRTCAAVSVQPWHVGLAHRQQAAAAYAGALVTLLQTVASQGRGAFAGDPTLLDLRAAAGIDDH